MALEALLAGVLFDRDDDVVRTAEEVHEPIVLGEELGHARREHAAHVRQQERRVA